MGSVQILGLVLHQEQPQCHCHVLNDLLADTATSILNKRDHYDLSWYLSPQARIAQNVCVRVA